MLPEERDLLRRDRELGGLAELLDPERFSEAISRAAGIEVSAARRNYARYKPGVNCLVGYELETSRGDLSLYARTHRAGSDEKISGAESGVISVENASVYYEFPRDRRLPLLESLADHPRRRRNPLADWPLSLAAGQLRTIRYKPERRWVACLEVGSKPVAAVKVYSSAGFRRADVASDAFGDRDLLRVTHPIHRVSSPRGAIVWPWLVGELLSEEIYAGRVRDSDLHNVGRALAELHAQRCEGLPVLHAEQAERALVATARDVAVLLPELGARCDALLGRLAPGSSTGAGRLVALHGDFYAKQVLLAEDRVGVIDFDSACIGPPERDLALFGAHLWSDAVRGRLAEDRVEGLEAAFLSGYRGHRGHRGDQSGRAYSEADLLRERAAGLFGLLHHPFRSGDPEWPQAIERVLELCERLAPETTRAGPPSASATRVKVAVSDPFDITRDEHMPFLASALDPDRVEQTLQRIVADHDLLLRSIEVTRHKPGRRCNIEFEVDLRSVGRPRRKETWIAKFRARGLDRTTLGVVEDFSRRGFTAAQESDVCVSLPTGAVSEWNMWLQKKVRGRLATVELAGENGEAIAVRIADALYRIHQENVPCRRVHGMDDELRILTDRLSRLPESWGPRIDAVLERFRTRTAALGPRPTTGIHRDFYADQVLVEAERIHVIDFDLFCVGDPALDVGNFSGHLLEQATRQPDDAVALRRSESAFRARYLERAGLEHSGAIDLYTDLTLARHIYLSTRFRDRRAYTGQIADLAESRVAIATAR